MDEADRIIIESTDTALSNIVPNMKDAIYRTLDISFGIKPEDIAAHYDLFYDSLEKILPKLYIKVIREIVTVLHQRSTSGVYKEKYAIEAFGKLVTVNLEKTKRRVVDAEKMFGLAQNEELLKFIREKDKKLKESERLVAIGETAGMVGHDIRNPLQAMLGDVFVAQSDVASLPDVPEKESLKESLDSIQTNISYINLIVADLQDYARQLNPSSEEIDLKSLIERLIISVPSNIQVEINVDSKTQRIFSDPTFLRRILTNLISNAAQAMPNGGQLSINVDTNSDTAIISVEDTGGGIPDDVRDKLFTPLFTTKSKGQGLGLASAKRMVEALDGTILFESQVGKGTKFTICIPISKTGKNVK